MQNKLSYSSQTPIFPNFRLFFRNFALASYFSNKFVTGPAKIGHVGSQNLTTFQTFVTHNFLLQHGMATQFSAIVHNLTGFSTHPTEPKYYISILRYVSSNHLVYFSPHALFLQARSHLLAKSAQP